MYEIKSYEAKTLGVMKLRICLQANLQKITDTWE